MTNASKDMLGGALLFAAGLWVTLYCVAHYDLGSLRRMGTGAYPALAGSILALLGLAIALPPLLRGDRPTRFALPPLRASAAVLGAVLAFALLVRPFGLFPAIAALVSLSSLAGEERPTPGTLAAMIAALCLLAWLVFGLGLSLGLHMLDWPW
ncbi:tripartite tricarboxylate transporter TctB family protein [Salipiger sp.]|uniref:tripartite tricarboxylate transporter TctB family protein n=1 Tax=Salipiger sp. TaxID=2078585 RepID=UPI003A97C44C